MLPRGTRGLVLIFFFIILRSSRLALAFLPFSSGRLLAFAGERGIVHQPPSLAAASREQMKMMGDGMDSRVVVRTTDGEARTTQPQSMMIALHHPWLDAPAHHHQPFLAGEHDNHAQHSRQAQDASTTQGRASIEDSLQNSAECQASEQGFKKKEGGRRFWCTGQHWDWGTLSSSGRGLA